jgi:hypothetical protein
MLKIGLVCVIMCLVQCDELLFVAEVTTPGFYYPKAEVFEWSKGKSFNLANAGLRQQYLLGRELRRRYMEDTKLLSERYEIMNRKQIRIRTTSETQTVASAYAQLMGLYTPGSGDLLTPNEISRAMPPNVYDYSVWTEELETAALNYTYQTMPLEQYGGIADNLLNSEEHCYTVRSLLDSALSSNQDKHKSLFNTLADALGVNREIIANVRNASDMRYALILSVAEGKSPNNDPEKAYKIYKDTVEVDKAYIYDHMLNIESDGRNVTKIITSPLLREITSLLESSMQTHIQTNTKAELRFVLYSGELHLFLALLKQLNVGSSLVEPLTASALLLELFFKSNTEDRTINNYYIKITCDKEEKLIPMGLFIGDMKNITLDSDDYVNHCNDFPEDDFFTLEWILILAIGGGALVVGLLVLAVCLLRARCKGELSDDDAEQKILETLQNRLNFESPKDEL